MRKILFLGSSFGVVPIIQCAKTEGYYVIVTDYLEEKRSKAKQIADEIWNISTAELDVLERKCRENNVSALLCGISEFNLDAVLELAERLDLPCYCSKEQREYSKNKRMFKEMCRKLDILVPEDYKVEELDQNMFIGDKELVVKPIDCAGSEGVSFCKNFKELKYAVKLAQEKGHSDDIIIERRLKGKEFFAVYCFEDGNIELITLNEMYSQNGYPSKCYSIVTNTIDWIQKFCIEIDPQIRNMFRHIGYRNGCAWVQTILNSDDSFYLIEMGAEYRLPDMRPVNGFNYAKWLLNCALGKKNSIDCFMHTNRIRKDRFACEYLFWTRESDIIEEIAIDINLESSGIVVEMLVMEGDKVEAYHIIGHALYYAADRAQLNEKLKLINDGIRVSGNISRDIMIHYRDEIK